MTPACRWAAVAIGALLRLGTETACAAPLTGRVVDSEQRPLAGIAVAGWSTRAADAGPRVELARTTSGADGRFRLDTQDAVIGLLTLDGPSGTGRVPIDAATATEVLVPYPVRTTVVLLHDNDLHFNANHADRFEAEIARIRREHRNVFLLNAGDLFIRSRGSWNEPTDAFYADHARAMVDRLNLLGYAAVTLGNHELDYVGDLTKTALDRAEFPLLAANIDVTTDRLPKPEPFTVLTTDNDLSILVIGLSTVNFAKEGVAMRDAIVTLSDLRPQIEGHDICVALTHIGFVFDQVLARTQPGIDVILGAHCHTLLAEAVTANGVLIAQAGGTGADRRNPVDPDRPKYLGIVTLTLENSRIVGKSGRVVTFGPTP